MSSFKELFSHSSIYFIGRLLSIAAGFISMPVLTRALTKEDYGLMSLVFLALTFFSTFAAFGFPQATTRFFYEYKTGNDRKDLRQFCTSISIGSVMTGTVAMVIVIVFSYIIENSKSFSEVAYYLRFASILILIRVVGGVVQQIFRADKMPFIYNLVDISKRYLTVLCVIILVVYFYRNIKGVLIGTIIVEGAVLMLCLLALYYMGNLDLNFGSSAFMVKAVKFGFPLVMADLLTTIVSSCDRFAIQYFLNAEAVASYSVAYDLSEYTGIMFASPIQLAIMPLIFEMWIKQGPEKTSAFVSQALKYTCILVIPIICGFSVVGENVIVFIASDKYAGSGVLVPYIISGIMFSSIQFLFFSGLLIQKKSSVLLYINLSGSILNVLLNIILIPQYGISGAAYATLMTYMFILLITHNVSSRYLKIQIHWKLIAKVIFISIAMYLLVDSLGSIHSRLFVDIMLKGIIGMVFYGTSLLAVDREIRTMIIQEVKLFYDRR